MNSAEKFLLIGWDGATFDIIEPLVKQGRLPNVASLMENGVWGRLESTIPFLTPVAWTSISTGVNPGKHGIYDVMAYTTERQEMRFVNSTMRKVKPVWSILSEQGKKVGVINVPLTYPPEKVNGFIIPGMFTPDGLSNFIYPPELQTEIENRFGKYLIDHRPLDDPSAYLKLITDLISFREKVTLYLIDRYDLDFLFVTFVASDRVQHFFWKYLNPSHPKHDEFSDSIALVYEKMDETLGRLLEKTGKDTTVMMVSDHGAGPLKRAFFLNHWLEKKGYLFLKKDPAEAFKQKKLPQFKSSIIKSIKKVIPRVLWNNLKPKGVSSTQRNFNLFFTLIDWEKTVLFSEGVGGAIFVNSKTVKPDQYEETVDRLIQELCDVTDPDNGEKVIKTVHRRNEIYKGEYVRNAPDLTVICRKGYHIVSPSDFFYFKRDYEDVLFLSHRWSGKHEQDGIFLLKGPAVTKKAKIKECNTTDIAPMILYLMNMAVPEYMDGRVLSRAIEKKYFVNNPVRYDSHISQQEKGEMSLSEKEESEIAERLKGLGYLE